MDDNLKALRKRAIEIIESLSIVNSKDIGSARHRALHEYWDIQETLKEKGFRLAVVLKEIK